MGHFGDSRREWVKDCALCGGMFRDRNPPKTLADHCRPCRNLRRRLGKKRALEILEGKGRI